MIKDELGITRPLTFVEMYNLLGAGRIILPKVEGLISWAKYKYAGCASSEVYQGMTVRGLEQGSNPKDWFAVFRNIPASEWIGIDKWDGQS